MQNVLRGVWVGYPGPFTAGGGRGAGSVHPVRHGGPRRRGRALAGGGAQGSPRARRGDLQDPQRARRRLAPPSRRNTIVSTKRRSNGIPMADLDRQPRRSPPRRRRARFDGEPEWDASALGPSRARRWLGPDYRLGFLFVLPIVVLVLALVAYPFCYAVYLSMTRKYVGHAARLRRLRQLRQAHLRRVLPARRRTTASSSRSAPSSSSSCSAWAWRSC